MSYARFGWEGSDVYLFASAIADVGVVEIECCGCWLSGESVSFVTIEAVDDHLRLHEQAGHVVVDRPRILAEIRRDGFVT